MQIIPTENEIKIVEFLQKVVTNKAPDTTLRLVGGYIRDKLMGLESHDLDVAIDNMSGQAFAKLIVEQLKEDGLHGQMNVIESNPDQSKHLETAQVKLFGQTIDLVNLRKESYAESRIPVIEIGTPEEDAKRRDLTINAIFFNLRTMALEDFTGFGINDLQTCTIRTPIDPLQTFLDDPLRVLRAIRFAAKFNFILEDELLAAASNTEVHEAFKKKISKERVWSELIGQEEPGGYKLGMLTGPNPVYALNILAGIGFRDILFRPENEELNHWETDQNSPHHDLNIWEHTLTAFKYLWLSSIENGKSKYEPKDFAVRNLACLLHDLGKCDHNFIQTHPLGHLSYHEHELGSAKHSETVLNQLNCPLDMKERIVRLTKEHMRLHVLDADPSDKSLRKFLRELGDDWEHSVDIAIADSYGKARYAGQFVPEVGAKYENYRTRLQSLLGSQHGRTTIARPISGHDLIKIGMKPGPAMGVFFKELDELLLETPDMTAEAALNLAQERMTND